MSTTIFQWNTANFIWNNNPYTWDEVVLIESLLAAGEDEWQEWNKNKKDKINQSLNSIKLPPINFNRL